MTQEVDPDSLAGLKSEGIVYPYNGVASFSCAIAFDGQVSMSATFPGDGSFNFENAACKGIGAAASASGGAIGMKHVPTDGERMKFLVIVAAKGYNGTYVHFYDMDSNDLGKCYFAGIGIGLAGCGGVCTWNKV